MTIIATPGSFVSNVAITVLLPTLSEVSDEAAFAKRFRYAGIAITFVAGVIFIPAIFLGRQVVMYAFGPGYNPGLELISVIVLGQAAALVRIWSNIGALALGDSKNVVASNVPRASGIVFALAAIHFGLGVMGIAVSFALGEIIALFSAFWQLGHRRSYLRLGTFQLVGILYAGLILAVETARRTQGHFLGALAASFLFVCLLGMAFLIISAESRGMVQMLRAQRLGWQKYVRVRAQ